MKNSAFNKNHGFVTTSYNMYRKEKRLFSNIRSKYISFLYFAKVPLALKY